MILLNHTGGNIIVLYCSLRSVAEKNRIGGRDDTVTVLTIKRARFIGVWWL